MTQRTTVRLICALLAAALMLGCGKIKKTQECKAFISKLNASLREIEKHNAKQSGDEKEKVEKIKKLGELYTQLSTDVEAMKFSDGTLAKHASEYQGMTAKAADIATRLVTALDKGESQNAIKIQDEFDAVVEHEGKLVETINGFCSAP